MINTLDINNLKESLQTYMRIKCKLAKGSKYTCPVCNSGGNQNHTSALKVYKGTNSWYCHSCHNGGDVFNLAAAILGKDAKSDFEEIAQDVASTVGYRLNTYNAAYTPKAKAAPAATPKPKADFTELMQEAHKAAGESSYFAERGLTKGVVDSYKLGYITPALAAKYKLQADSIFIPYFTLDVEGTARCTYYITRATKVKQFRKPAEELAGSEPVYNLPALYKDTTEPLFVTEAQLDALSVIESGGDAVALNGTGDSKLLQVLQDLQSSGTPLKRPLIIALDADDAGCKAGIKLLAVLANYGVKAILYKHAERCKDINDELRADSEQLERNIQRHINLLDKNNQPAANYLQEVLGEIQSAIYSVSYSTGIETLDAALNGGIKIGVYVLGAMSGAGKTTLALQIANNIAASGQDVLYLSLEMTTAELITKSISRNTYLIAKQKNLTHKELLQAACTTNDILSKNMTRIEAKKEVFKQATTNLFYTSAKNLFIRERDGIISAGRLKEIIEAHKKRYGIYPVVFVDYLQLIALADKSNLSDKQKMDTAIEELKTISKDLKIPIVAISSLNRMSYDEPLNMGSFKESGMIEYTADCVIGLEVALPECAEGKSAAAQKQRKKFLAENAKLAKEGHNIVVELKILKSRLSASNQSIKLACCNMFNNFGEASSQELELLERYDKKGNAI